jgi:hypothetical protein
LHVKTDVTADRLSKKGQNLELGEWLICKEKDGRTEEYIHPPFF